MEKGSLKLAPSEYILSLYFFTDQFDSSEYGSEYELSSKIVNADLSISQDDRSRPGGNLVLPGNLLGKSFRNFSIFLLNKIF